MRYPQAHIPGIFFVSFLIIFFCYPAWPQTSLRGVQVPEPPNLIDFIKNRTAAIQLGKALFWDMQVGSDGIQACASCHFNSGADSRAKNQINPGLRAVPPDIKFQFGGPNFTLSLTDLPLPLTVNDVVASQGVYHRIFNNVIPGSAVDDCVSEPDPEGFRIGTVNTRRSPPRNVPSVINAVFNFRNLWDGRANNVFSGVNPFGPGQERGNSIFQEIGGVLTPVPVAIPNASLASQATGPPLNPLEMSCRDRTFPKIGRKMLSLTPLARQKVDPNDSVLGPIAASRVHPVLKGLTESYPGLVQQAFVDSWWNSLLTVNIGNDTFTQMEANFSLFFGLAIQIYLTTQVSDSTPFDRFTDPVSPDPNALTPQQQRGLTVFTGQGRCNQCHLGPLFSEAGDPDPLNALVDIGVRPVNDDPGAGPILGSPGVPDFDGRFKIPQLRNVELTAPYFHNGGKGTLEQVVQFYDRGGDFDNINKDGNIQLLALTSQDIQDLVAFLQSLTDERVRLRQPPFDRPAICVPNGHPGNETSVIETEPGSGEARDNLRCFRAVGSAGSTNPLKTFPLGPTFGDLSESSFAFSHAEEMFDASITLGCSANPLLFCPTDSVTRGQMAAFIVRAVDGVEPAVCTGNVFPDVPIGHPFCAHIERLMANRITLGIGGFFRPEFNVTRAEVASFIVRGLDGADAPGPCTGVFNDVPIATSHCANIERLAALNITLGCGGGNYCPAANVSREQMAAFIARAFLGIP
jgi:cytochrome c peroxidase